MHGPWVSIIAGNWARSKHPEGSVRVIYGDLEEAVMLANDLIFELSAAVFSADADAAQAVVERL